MAPHDRPSYHRWLELDRVDGMRRAGIVGLVVVVFAAMWWAVRRGDEPAEAPARRSAVRPATVPRRPAPRPVAPPSAPAALRLEGRVIGPDGRGVDGAAVMLDQSPSTAALSGADGAFAI